MQPLDYPHEELDLILCLFPPRGVPGSLCGPIDVQSRWEPRGLA